MKKFVALIVCCVMLVVALVFDPGVMTNKMSVGAGNGTSVEIEDLDDLYDVIESVYEGDLISMSEDYELLATSKAKKKKISSLTIEITNKERYNSSSNSSSSGSSNNSNYNEKSNSETTLYITKDSVFCTTKGSVYYSRHNYSSSSTDGYYDYYNNWHGGSSRSSTTNFNSTITFDMDVYIEDDTAMVRFRHFFVESETMTESTYSPSNGAYESDRDTDNYSAYIDFAYLNQWIKIPADVALDLLDETGIEDSIEVLEEYADFIDSDDLKKKSDGVYTYTDKDDNDYYDRYKLEIKYDLTGETSPTLESVVDYSYDSYNSGYNSSSSNGSREASNLIVISNINNTKVDLDNIKPAHSFKNEEKFMDEVWRENDD